jgi:hypothetical protein
LWESITQVDDRGWQMAGLTGNYLRVSALASRPIWNEVSQVRVESVEGDRLAGVIMA